MKKYRFSNVRTGCYIALLDNNICNSNGLHFSLCTCNAKNKPRNLRKRFYSPSFEWFARQVKPNITVNNQPCRLWIPPFVIAPSFPFLAWQPVTKFCFVFSSFFCLFGFFFGGGGEGDVNTRLALTLSALRGRSKRRFPHDNHGVTIATVRYLHVLVLNRVRWYPGWRSLISRRKICGIL